MMVVNARFLTQPLTGVQRYAFEVSMQIRQQRPETVFLSPRNIQQKAWAKALGARVCGTLRGHFWEQLELPKYLKQFPGALLFSPGNTGPLSVRRQFLTLHDLAFLQKPPDQQFLFRKYYRFLIPTLLPRISHLFTVSDTVRNEIIRQYQVPTKKVSVTLNGLSEIFSEPGGPLPRKKFLLAVGSSSPRKRTGFLVRSFLQSGLADEYKLKIVGQGSGPYLKTEWPSHPSVTLLGAAGDEELLQLYREASGLIALSSYEGFGIPLLEALSQKCPVACSDIPVFRELFAPMVHFLPVGDEHEAGKAMREWVFSGPSQPVSLNDLHDRFNYRRSAMHILDCAKPYENLPDT